MSKQIELSDDAVELVRSILNEDADFGEDGSAEAKEIREKFGIDELEEVEDEKTVA